MCEMKSLSGEHMPYTLYGSFGSGSLIVELALAEIGIEYEFRTINLRADEQQGPGYGAMNPQRKLPTLVMPNGEALTESVAILLTLDRLYPAAELLPPPNSNHYAQALRWLMFVASEIYPIVEINDYPERFTPNPGPGTEPMRDLARRIWRERWKIVESNISGNPYLLSSGFCLTDIYISVVSRWAQQEGWRPAHIPKIERLTEAVMSRPACEPIWFKNYG